MAASVVRMWQSRLCSWPLIRVVRFNQESWASSRSIQDHEVQMVRCWASGEGIRFLGRESRRPMREQLESQQLSIGDSILRQRTEICTVMGLQESCATVAWLGPNITRAQNVGRETLRRWPEITLPYVISKLQ